jgi:outer membrane murein-binding lipoprotein Lpp
VVGNIQMDVDLTPLVSNIDINRERLGNLQGNVTTLEAVVGNIQMDVDFIIPGKIEINHEHLGNLQTKFTKLESTVVGNSTTDTPGLVWDVQTLQTNFKNLESTIEGDYITNTPGLVRDVHILQGNVTTLEAVVGNIQMDVDLTPLVSNIDINREKLGNLQTSFTNLEAVVGNIQMDVDLTPLVSNIDINRERLGNLQGNVTTLEAVVGNIQMDVDLTPLVSNIDINRERLDNLQGNVTTLEATVLPGLVGNVTALQSSVTDIRGDNPDSSINLSLLYGIILDLQSKVNVLKDPFSVQVVSSTTTEIKMRLQGRSLGDITVNIGGQIFKIINYDGNYELLVTGLQPTTIYDVTVNFENLSFTYDIQMTTI